MQVKQQTSREYFTFLTVIHLAMVLGQIIFGILAFYMVSSGQVIRGENQLDGVFRVLVPVFILGGLAGSWLFNRIRVNSIIGMTDLKEKLAGYRSSFITKLAILELPSLLAIVAFLLTANYLFLTLAGLIILVFLINRPTKSGIANDLKLNVTERALIEQHEEIVS